MTLAAARTGTARSRVWHRVSRVFGLEASLSNLVEAERGRWLGWVTVAFGAGIVCYFRLPQEPSLALVLAIPVMGLGLRLAVRDDGGFGSLMLWLVLTATLGFSVAKLRTEWTRAPVLERKMNMAEVRGAVELIEPRPGRGQRLTIKVSSIRGVDAERTPKRIRIRVMTRAEALKPGDRIRIRATLAPPAQPALPGGYDFGRAAWYLGIGATGYALVAPDIEEPLGEGSLAAWLEGVRHRLGERITAALPGEAGAIATSLITGERGAIPDEVTDAFRDSGLIHILSISGLHMVIMAGAVFSGTRLLLAAFPAVALRYPTKKWAAGFALVAGFGYLLLSGSSIATVRAFLMISIMFIAVMADRPALAMRNVAWSALIILCIMPESVLDAGFQMSFAAVTALVAGYEALRDRSEESELWPGFLRGAALFLGGVLISTVIASLAVAPFGIYHFHKSQQFALIANLIAVPICNLVVMPAALMTLVVMPLGLEALPLAVMGVGIDAMIATAVWVAGLPGAVVSVPAISDLAFGLIITGGLWLTLWRRRWRALGLIGIAAGVAMATRLDKPAVLVGMDGTLVAVRQSDGLLALSPGRQHEFEASRWLEHDGDARTAAEARKGDGFRCDGVGCVARHAGLVVSVARHGAAIADDCARAAILIASLPVARMCEGPSAIIDYAALRRLGAHALYVDGTAPLRLRIETVQGARGLRPWSEPRQVQRGEAQHGQTRGRIPRGQEHRGAPRWDERSRRDAESTVRSGTNLVSRSRDDPLAPDDEP